MNKKGASKLKVYCMRYHLGFRRMY